MFSRKKEKNDVMMPPAGGEHINAEQEQAIRHKDGPMMVLAGPGSGKTFVITRRLRCMIEEYGIPPEAILVITFTRAAAREMEERFCRMMGDAGAGVVFGTFHAIYFHILRNAYHLEDSCILSEKEKRRFLREAVSAYPEVAEEEQTFTYLLTAISRIKNAGIAPEEFHDESCIVAKDVFVKIFREYLQICKTEGKLDFDDMVLLCRDLFLEHPEILKVWQKRYRYLLIDEFQDINPMQYEVVRMLAAPEDNLFVVGDDDQSIYGFRGSDPQIMLGFPKDYPLLRSVLLKNNYRSTQGIVESALRLVGNNHERYPKKLRAQKESANDVTGMGFADKEEEAAAVIKVIRSAAKYRPYRETAMLFRTNASAAFYTQKLSAEGIPFYCRERIGSIFGGPAGQDILAMFAYAHGSYERRHLLRFLNKPARYIRRSLLENEDCDLHALLLRNDVPLNVKGNIRRLMQDLKLLKDMHPFAGVNFIRKGMGYESYLLKEAREKGKDTTEIMEILDLIMDSTRQADDYPHWLEQIDAYEASLAKSAKEQKEDAVQLLTMHGAKGLEFTTVILTDVNEGILPQKRAEQEKDAEEERRVFYVAMTRAKEKLFLFYLNKNPEKKIRPSRFLKEIGLKC